jgi:heavy metal efflux system protein
LTGPGSSSGCNRPKKGWVAIPITLGLILVLPYGLFNSLRDSHLALFGLPFAVCGGILGLYVSGLDFSISAAIGFRSLFGVSVISGILIINGYYRVFTSGMSSIEAMSRAVGGRCGRFS